MKQEKKKHHLKIHGTPTTSQSLRKLYQRTVAKDIEHIIAIGLQDTRMVVSMTPMAPRQVSQIVESAMQQQRLLVEQQLQGLGQQLQQLQQTLHQERQETREAANMKIDFQPFDSENAAEFYGWSSVYFVHCRAVGCAEELTPVEGQGFTVGSEDFDSSDENPVRVRNS